MKKLFLSAFLGLAVFFQVPRLVSASGTFGLFTCGGCNRCGCGVCIRPYNAFSPVLCGSICVDNCFPFCGPQYGGCSSCSTAPMLPPGPMVGMPMAPMMAGPLAPLSDPARSITTPTKPSATPAPTMPTVPGKNEQPTAMPKGPASAAMVPAMQPGMVQPVGYYPYSWYYPGYGYGYNYGYAPMVPPYAGYYYNPAMQQPGY